jgi:hypothetical protein
MSADAFRQNLLLDEADAVMREVGFSTQFGVFSSADTPWLLAEDEFFLVAVIASGTLEAAQRAESFAAAELLDRLDARNVGAKRWDAYMVLLLEESVDDAERTREVAELQYNTRGVRRLVAAGVTDRESLAVALRPFLPLPRPEPGGLSDALADMADQLTLNGVDPEKSPRYVAVFAQTGSLDDV